MINYLIEFTIWLLVFYMVYKLLFFHTKRFRFTRFYLLVTLIASIILPLVEFTLPLETPLSFSKETVSFTESDLSFSHFEENAEPTYNQSVVNFNQVAIGIYLIGVFLMWCRYLVNLNHLNSRVKNSEQVHEGGCRLVLLDKPIKPFSFLNCIFVNKIDYLKNNIPNSILLHERVHIKQKHSIDILFLEFMLVLFYFHPLVWLYRKAIQANHEFLADTEVLKETEFQTYSNLILNYSGYALSNTFSCSFNQSFIKNRIIMLTKPKTKTPAFLRKILGACFLFATTFLFMCFSFSGGTGKEALKKDYTVVIDLGHGGKDPGASTKDATISEEKILTSIGKQMQSLEPSFKIIFTRNSNKFVTLEDRVKLTNRNNADLLVSIHVNHSPNSSDNGVTIFYSEENEKSTESREIAKEVVNSIDLGHSQMHISTANFKVLKDVKCPAIMLSLGYLSNNQDLKILLGKENHKRISKEIIEAVNKLN